MHRYDGKEARFIMGKMKKRVPFNTQLASIMGALAKAAVTEIRQIVEDDSVELRLEVSRGHKEINRLRRRLTEVESELRTALEAATRESRSVGVQVVDQFEMAREAVMGVMDAPFVEQLTKKKVKAQTHDTRPDFGFAEKEEQEEEHVTQILHQTESERSAGRLNNVGSEYVMFEIDNPLWSAFTQGDGDVTDDPISSSVTEQCSQSQSVLSPIQHTPASMEMCGNKLPNLEKDDYVVVGDVVKEEAGGQCLYAEESRSEVGDAKQTEHEHPPLSMSDNVVSQAIHPVQQQLDLLTGVTKRNTNPVSSSDQYTSVNRRPGKREKRFSCAQCQKSFDRFAELVRHQRIHTGEKPFSCAQCGKRFSLRGNLLRHERIHSGDKPLCCVHCGEKFWKREKLVTHERVHLGNKPFGCVHCGKRFARGWTLRVHNRIHTGERPYPCAQCGRSFTQWSGLKSHEKTHSRNTQRQSLPYKGTTATLY